MHDDITPMYYECFNPICIQYFNYIVAVSFIGWMKLEYQEKTNRLTGS